MRPSRKSEIQSQKETILMLMKTLAKAVVANSSPYEPFRAKVAVECVQAITEGKKIVPCTLTWDGKDIQCKLG